MTSTIIVKSDPKLKAQAQKTAADLGLTLTAVVNAGLEDFVQNKSISFGEKKNFKTPYGIFKDSKITDKDIDEVTSSWDKIVNELT